MKKTFLTLGALMIIGIASAQTDSTATRTTRTRTTTERNGTMTDRTQTTPEQIKDTANSKHMPRKVKAKTTATPAPESPPVLPSSRTNGSSPNPPATPPPIGTP